MWDKSWSVLFGIFRKVLGVVPPRSDHPWSWCWDRVGKTQYHDPFPCSSYIWFRVSSFSWSSHLLHPTCPGTLPPPLMCNVWQPCNRRHPCQAYHSTTTSHHCNQTATISVSIANITYSVDVTWPVEIDLLEILLPAGPTYLLVDIECAPVFQLNDLLAHLIPLALQLSDGLLGLAELLHVLRERLLRSEQLLLKLSDSLSGDPDQPLLVRAELRHVAGHLLQVKAVLVTFQDTLQQG